MMKEDNTQECSKMKLENDYKIKSVQSFFNIACRNFDDNMETINFQLRFRSIFPSTDQCQFHTASNVDFIVPFSCSNQPSINQRKNIENISLATSNSGTELLLDDSSVCPNGIDPNPTSESSTSKPHSSQQHQEDRANPSNVGDIIEKNCSGDYLGTFTFDEDNIEEREENNLQSHDYSMTTLLASPYDDDYQLWFDFRNPYTEFAYNKRTESSMEEACLLNGCVLRVRSENCFEYEINRQSVEDVSNYKSSTCSVEYKLRASDKYRKKCNAHFINLEPKYSGIDSMLKIINKHEYAYTVASNKVSSRFKNIVDDKADDESISLKGTTVEQTSIISESKCELDEKSSPRSISETDLHVERIVPTTCKSSIEPIERISFKRETWPILELFNKGDCNFEASKDKPKLSAESTEHSISPLKSRVKTKQRKNCLDLVYIHQTILSMNMVIPKVNYQCYVCRCPNAIEEEKNEQKPPEGGHGPLCRCAECLFRKTEESKDGETKGCLCQGKKTPKLGPNDPCPCDNCACAPCARGGGKDDPKRGETCDCGECKCDPCFYLTKQQPCTSAQPCLKPDEPAKACNCEPCVCKPCKDPTKNGK